MRPQGFGSPVRFRHSFIPTVMIYEICINHWLRLRRAESRPDDQVRKQIVFRRVKNQSPKA